MVRQLNSTIWTPEDYINGLAQDCTNSIANGLELLQFVLSQQYLHQWNILGTKAITELLAASKIGDNIVTLLICDWGYISLVIYLLSVEFCLLLH